MERQPQDGMEPVGNFQMCATISSAKPDGDERWAERAAVLARWLVTAWRWEQDRVGAMVFHEHDLN